jgi:hypothetical protein
LVAQQKPTLAAKYFRIVVDFCKYFPFQGGN